MEKYNKLHYNAVTDGWQSIMGDNLHFGYFKTEETPLSSATNELIDKMTELAKINKDTKILDVGCGIGNPAFYLHEKFKCSILGITTSDKGIEIANQLSREKGFSAQVQFQVADGIDNGLPANSFDLIWVLESSHLMPKVDLVNECYRVLKKNGTLLLCDIMLTNRLWSLKQLQIWLRHFISITRTGKVFGKIHMATQEYYWKAFRNAGFNEITSIDISERVIPTMRNWKENAIKNKDKISTSLSNRAINTFIEACDILESLYKTRYLSYTIFKAVKY
jgi:Methylase involved in ubiquinone/menaquinone biosynthesis